MFSVIFRLGNTLIPVITYFYGTFHYCMYINSMQYNYVFQILSFTKFDEKSLIFLKVVLDEVNYPCTFSEQNFVKENTKTTGLSEFSNLIDYLDWNNYHKRYFSTSFATYRCVIYHVAFISIKFPTIFAWSEITRIFAFCE